MGNNKMVSRMKQFFVTNENLLKFMLCMFFGCYFGYQFYFNFVNKYLFLTIANLCATPYWFYCAYISYIYWSKQRKNNFCQ